MKIMIFGRKTCWLVEVDTIVATNTEVSFAEQDRMLKRFKRWCIRHNYAILFCGGAYEKRS